MNTKKKEYEEYLDFLIKTDHELEQEYYNLFFKENKLDNCLKLIDKLNKSL